MTQEETIELIKKKLKLELKDADSWSSFNVVKLVFDGEVISEIMIESRPPKLYSDHE